MAEDAAREIPNLPLEDALQLVHLYAERGSPKYEKAALRWLSIIEHRGLRHNLMDTAAGAGRADRPANSRTCAPIYQARDVRHLFGAPRLHRACSGPEYLERS